MMNYRNIQLPSSRILEWGKQGENKATRLSVDVSEFIELSEGTIAVSCCRPDGKKYPHDCTINDTTVEIELSSYDTQVSGILTIVVSWMCGERIVKSETYCGEISRSISTSGEKPTPPFDGLIEQVCNAAIKAKESADIAEAAAERAENAGGIAEETDPTVPAWAKQPTKPSYTADEVNARPANWKPTLQEIGAASAVDVVKLSGEITQLKDDLAAITPDDNAVDGKPWTSEKIVEALCPPFETTGSIVQCHPVEHYPLGVVSRIEPVQAGSGDPSPGNVRPISGWDSVSLNRCGKNLFSVGSANIFIGISGQETPIIGSATTPKIPCKAGDKFILTCKNTFAPAPGNIGVVAFYDASDALLQRISNTHTNNITSTAPENAYYVLASCYAPTEADEIVFELGSTATPYEPYTGDTYTAELPETIYGGELDWNTGVLTVTQKHYALPISAMNNHEEYPGWKNVEWALDLVNEGVDDILELNACNISTRVRANTQGGQKIIYCSKIDMGGLTQTEIKETYPDLILEFVAYLLTPYTIQLTPQQIAVLPGVNTLYTDAGTLTVTGREDPRHTIVELKNAILSLGGNI